MSQQYPPHQTGRGGRGAGPGGRGAAAGGGPPGQPFQYQGRGGGGAPRPMGAWQPMEPPVQQAPAGYNPQQAQQQQLQPGQQQLQRGPPPQQGYGPPQGYYNPYAAQQQQQQQQQQAYPRGSWQPAGYAPSNMRGGVFYPPPGGAPPTAAGAAAGGAAPQVQSAAAPQAAAAAPTVQPPVPRVKKPLVITDRNGNVIDLMSAAPKKAAAPALAPPKAVASEPASDHGAKLRQAALARIEDKTKKEPAGDTAKIQAEEKATLEAAQDEAKMQALEKAKKEAELKAKKEAELKAKKEAELKAKKEVQAAAAPKTSFSSALLKQPPKAPPVPASGRSVYNKAALLRLKELPVCMQRPESLPDMTITKGQPRGKSGGGGNRRDGARGNDGGGGGSSWERGSAPPRRQSTDRPGGQGGQGGGNGGNGGGGSWSRGQAPPKQQPNQKDNQGGHRGGRGQPPPLYDGPVAPLVKSENHWRPRKNTSAIVIAEKKVKSILNKMTKDKFDRLSTQMIEIPILSYEMLNIMLENVYDKAIDEPTFGDMYADLCVRLSQSVKGSEFVHILKSDEEPPSEADPSTDSTPNGAESSSYVVYRWSNDVSTTDSEVVGPYASEEECFAIAANQDNELAPFERGDMELELVSVSIRKGTVVKTMKKKDAEEGEADIFYTVYFPVGDAEDCDQQLSVIFLSEMECRSDATKKNSFKSSLLNKCEVEFNKQDIYVDWKKENKDYEENKSTMTEAERVEKEGNLNFRRIRIKKQMLGNIKFIGQLFKKGLLKEKIMRFCIASLMKLEELTDVKSKNPEYKDSGEMDMDEEDHEAICSMFTTVGATLEQAHAQAFVKVCFDKIHELSNNEALPSRSRFMYKDLLELRVNRWVPRRKEEKAKTLEEIRKDVEREERRQKQESSRGGGGGGGYNPRGSGSGDYRSGGRQQPSFGNSNRARQPKVAVTTDKDGFTVIAAKSAAPPPPPPKVNTTKVPQSKPSPAPAEKKSTDTKPTKSSSAPEPLDSETLERRIKSMRSDYVSDGGIIDELLLTMDEISGTPEAGLKLVSTNAERLMDCKDNERNAINSIITILFEKKKLTSEDVRNGLMDAIEFIDSFVMDSPKAFQYLGDLLGALLILKAFDVPWLCEQLEKTKVDPGTRAPEKVIRFTFAAAKASGDAVIVKNAFTSADKALLDLLDADSWAAISQEL